MRARLVKDIRFEASHRLPNLPDGHKCARLHGHSYKISVEVEGEVDPVSGWVMDYAEIAEAFRPLREQLDHHYLNEIEGLENPTSENLAAWIWPRLHERLPQLRRLTIEETGTARCVYEGPTAERS